MEKGKKMLSWMINDFSHIFAFRGKFSLGMNEKHQNFDGTFRIERSPSLFSMSNVQWTKYYNFYGEISYEAFRT